MATKTSATQQAKPSETKPAPLSTHSVQHIEIASTEPEKLSRFLAKQFGWEFQAMAMPQGGTYHVFRTPNGNGGGVWAPAPGQPAATTPYINVEDIEAAVKSCQKAGAEIMMPVTEVPGQGLFFWFRVHGSPPLACWEQTGPRN